MTDAIKLFLPECKNRMTATLLIAWDTTQNKYWQSRQCTFQTMYPKKNPQEIVGRVFWRRVFRPSATRQGGLQEIKQGGPTCSGRPDWQRRNAMASVA